MNGPEYGLPEGWSVSHNGHYDQLSSYLCVNTDPAGRNETFTVQRKDQITDAYDALTAPVAAAAPAFVAEVHPSFND